MNEVTKQKRILVTDVSGNAIWRTRKSIDVYLILCWECYVRKVWRRGRCSRRSIVNIAAKLLTCIDVERRVWIPGGWNSVIYQILTLGLWFQMKRAFMQEQLGNVDFAANTILSWRINEVHAFARTKYYMGWERKKLNKVYVDSACGSPAR